MAVGFELCGDLSAKTVVGLRSEIALLLAEPARPLFRKGAAPNFDQSPERINDDNSILAAPTEWFTARTPFHLASSHHTDMLLLSTPSGAGFGAC